MLGGAPSGQFAAYSTQPLFKHNTMCMSYSYTLSHTLD